jgi:hypothetical protein
LIVSSIRSYGQCNILPLTFWDSPGSSVELLDLCTVYITSDLLGQSQKLRHGVYACVLYTSPLTFWDSPGSSGTASTPVSPLTFWDSPGSSAELLDLCTVHITSDLLGQSRKLRHGVYACILYTSPLTFWDSPGSSGTASTPVSPLTFWDSPGSSGTASTPVYCIYHL